MSVQSITLNLPDTIYRRLQGVATALNRPLEEVIFQSIQGNLPPVLDDVPTNLQTDLLTLQAKSDQSLWKLAKSQVPPKQWARQQELLEKKQIEGLTQEESVELDHLRNSLDDLVMRRSYALALLKWRGHSIAPLLASPTN